MTNLVHQNMADELDMDPISLYQLLLLSASSCMVQCIVANSSGQNGQNGSPIGQIPEERREDPASSVQCQQLHWKGELSIKDEEVRRNSSGAM
ncbi:hypothetical protein K7X08_011093 [Anisodus acutangulus]|uniref:Uncharacterized protein n=1 Tax=Anisodus acutangulus TaxID=402998 RepID=A0A9Q1M2Z6_9SOLA|nr:hypothetical protein K7X08_011093 [Anisodus acutangulus]